MLLKATHATQQILINSMQLPKINATEWVQLKKLQQTQQLSCNLYYDYQWLPWLPMITNDYHDYRAYQDYQDYLDYQWLPIITNDYHDYHDYQ